jgi:hypothetical protein
MLSRSTAPTIAIAVAVSGYLVDAAFTRNPHLAAYPFVLLPGESIVRHATRV